MFRNQLFFLTFALFAAGCTCGKPQNVVCERNADCDEQHPYCLEDLSGCVECLDGQQCESGFCTQAGTCGTCGPNKPCKQGDVCGADGQCHAGCDTNTAGCPNGLYCKPNSVVCVECLDNAQCGPGRICKDDKCVPGCEMGSALCPQNQVCDFTTNTCVFCLSNQNCSNSTTPVCNPATKTCVQCTANSDCKNPNAPVCDPSTNTCVTCTQNSQCPMGQVCQNKTCVPGCTPTQACPNGQQCALNGTCVQCTTDVHCAGVTGKTRCDTATNTCVECNPGAGDNCGPGRYCRNDHVCEQGCKTGVDCPSGICLPSHSCQGCTADSQCAAGNVCDNGTCVAACSPTSPCGAGKSCCGSHCFDIKTDDKNCGACGNVCGSGTTCCNGACAPLNTPSNCGACGKSCGANQGCCAGSCTGITTQNHCGACGVTCTVDQFCDGSSCKDKTFPNFCANKKVYAIYDGIAIDDAATNVLASTIQQNCPQTTMITYGPQSNPQYVDQTTGALLLGTGSTVVTAGGPFPNKPVKWLERTQQVTKVYFATNGIDTYYFKKRGPDTILTQMTNTTCTPHRDRFLIELATDPSSGTLALIGYGVCPGGYATQASAYFWANVMLPNRSAYPDGWYIFDWTDTNNDSVANAGDTFTKLVSGL